MGFLARASLEMTWFIFSYRLVSPPTETKANKYRHLERLQMQSGQVVRGLKKKTDNDLFSLSHVF